jgi:hypothetical protein
MTLKIPRIREEEVGYGYYRCLSAQRKRDPPPMTCWSILLKTSLDMNEFD